MSTKSTCWHWPDHVIGKRESRRLREEHNKLANEHAELADALEALCADPYLADPINADRMHKARNALAKAQGSAT